MRFPKFKYWLSVALTGTLFLAASSCKSKQSSEQPLNAYQILKNQSNEAPDAISSRSREARPSVLSKLDHKRLTSQLSKIQYFYRTQCRPESNTCVFVAPTSRPQEKMRFRTKGDCTSERSVKSRSIYRINFNTGIVNECFALRSGEEYISSDGDNTIVTFYSFGSTVAFRTCSRTKADHRLKITDQFITAATCRSGNTALILEYRKPKSSVSHLKDGLYAKVINLETPHPVTVSILHLRVNERKFQMHGERLSGQSCVRGGKRSFLASPDFKDATISCSPEGSADVILGGNMYRIRLADQQPSAIPVPLEIGELSSRPVLKPNILQLRSVRGLAIFGDPSDDVIIKRQKDGSYHSISVPIERDTGLCVLGVRSCTEIPKSHELACVSRDGRIVVIDLLSLKVSSQHRVAAGDWGDIMRIDDVAALANGLFIVASRGRILLTSTEKIRNRDKIQGVQIIGCPCISHDHVPKYINW